jgi:hypothetical protein
LIVLVASLVLLFKVGPKMRPFAMLGVVLGSATVISGVLLNSFFGQAILAGLALKMPLSLQVFRFFLHWHQRFPKKDRFFQQCPLLWYLDLYR